MSPNEPLIRVEDSLYPARAVVEALAPHITDARAARLAEIIDRRIGHIVLAVENLHYSHNASACLRTAEAFGLQDVVAVEDIEPLPLPLVDEPDGPTIAKKVSKTAHRWLDVHRLLGPDALADWTHARGAALFGALPARGEPLDTLPIDRPIVLLFGNEMTGIRPETERVCDGAFRIPMWGFTESFNVSVSVGIALQTLVPPIRTALAEHGAEGDLTPTRRLELTARWYAEDVRAAGPILRRKLGAGTLAT